MKTNDIHLAAYPKSGITYLSFLLTWIRAKWADLPIRPTFYNIDWLVIDSHKMAGREYADVWRDGMGNFIKTHDTWKNVPNVIYLLRNPFDTLKSYYHFEQQSGRHHEVRPFLHQACTSWCNHVHSWLIDNSSVSQSIFMVEYETLAPGIIAELGAQLGFDWDANLIEAAFQSCDRHRMREDERSFAINNPVYARQNMEFVRPGVKREVEGFEAYEDFIRERCFKTYCAITKAKL
jgi:hypothetical protein